MTSYKGSHFTFKKSCVIKTLVIQLNHYFIILLIQDETVPSTQFEVDHRAICVGEEIGRKEGRYSSFRR